MRLLYCFLVLFGLLISNAPAFGQESSAVDPQVQAFAEHVAELIKQGDPKAIEAVCDIKYDFRQIAGDTEFHFQDKEKWIQSLTEKAKLLPPLHTPLLFPEQTVESCQLISVRKVKDSHLAIERVFTDDGTLTYLWLTISPKEAGSFAVVACESTLSGGEISAFIRMLLTRYAPWETPDGMISDQAENAPALSLEKRYVYGMLQALKKMDLLSVTQLYMQLPPEIQDLQSQPLIAMVALQSALKLNEVAQSQQIEGLKQFSANTIQRAVQQCPKSPSIAFYSWDWFLENGQPDVALEQLQVLKQEIGNDPYLALNEAEVLVAKGETQEGYELVKQAMKSLGDIQTCYLIAASIYARGGDYKSTTHWLEQAEIKFDTKYHLDDLSDTAWKSFIESREYQEWQSKSSKPAAGDESSEP
ncbi:hypothetical protein [Aeoliella mucimassa]|uniref:Tetratricopeptide repeat protein n=1 Tax=Aeoliella mucimassa TaxID=2527972 RepID=A0A518AUK6_9BACT|nr:hypothetical protein [Aeoliella mucimassa]QDU58408.1 hypothetical protein Pan181_46430 [Aeoliella mucimassa]